MTPIIDIVNIYNCLIQLKDLRSNKADPFELEVHSTLDMIGKIVNDMSKKIILELHLKEILNELLFFNGISRDIISHKVALEQIENGQTKGFTFGVEFTRQFSIDGLTRIKQEIDFFLNNRLDEILEKYKNILLSDKLLYFHKDLLKTDLIKKDKLAQLIAKSILSYRDSRFSSTKNDAGATWHAGAILRGGVEKQYLLERDLTEQYGISLLSYTYSTYSMPKDEFIEAYSSHLANYPIDLLIQIANDFSLAVFNISGFDEL